MEGNRWVLKHEGNYYWLKTVLDEQDDPAQMPGSFREAVMPLKQSRGHFEVIRRKGEKTHELLDAALISDWKKRFPIRVGHDHPNEIFAYIFQAELTRKIMGEEPSGDPMTKKTMAWARKELK